MKWSHWIFPRRHLSQNSKQLLTTKQWTNIYSCPTVQLVSPTLLIIFHSFFPNFLFHCVCFWFFSSFLILCSLPPSHQPWKVYQICTWEGKWSLDYRLDKVFQFHQNTCLNATNMFPSAQNFSTRTKHSPRLARLMTHEICRVKRFKKGINVTTLNPYTSMHFEQLQCSSWSVFSLAHYCQLHEGRGWGPCCLFLFPQQELKCLDHS